MQRMTRVTIGAVLCFALTDHCGPANSQQPIAPELLRPPICDQFNVDGRASAPLRTVSLPPQQTCTLHTNNGFPVPDPNCTPGAINPTLTIEVLRDRSFTTRCIRDAATQEVEKATTYEWYNLPHPSNNSGDATNLRIGPSDLTGARWGRHFGQHMASMRAFRSLASPAVLQGKRYGREFSGDAGEGGPNGPERSAEGHRDRLDSVPRPSETSLPRGKVLLERGQISTR